VVRAVVERGYRSGKRLDRVLIAGSGELARAVVERVGGHRELGFTLVGYLRNGEESKLDGLECLGTIDDAVHVIDERKIDHVFVASVALLVFSPVMLLVAIIIKLEDRGPVFYRQERMGLDGKPFEIFKFRSMHVGAENESGAKWAEKDDPRRTRAGRFIRKTS